MQKLRSLKIVRAVTFAIALAFAGACFPGCSRVSGLLHISGANRYQHAQKQTVLIRTAHGQGSGVVIKRKGADGPQVFVWTAAHVVEGCAEVDVVQPIRNHNEKVGYTFFTGKVILYLPESDIALLWVDAPGSYFEAAEFADCAPPDVGTPLFHVGNFLGEPFDGSVSRGTQSQIGVFPRAAQGWPWQFPLDQATLAACPGSSGGPVFLENGKVVGLVVGAPGRGALGFVCYVPVRQIHLMVFEHGFSWALRGSHCPSNKILQADHELVISKIALEHVTDPVPEPEG